MWNIVLKQKNMLNSDEGGGPDVFFDSVDCFSPELGSSKIKYDIWMSEPRSVKERREGFLRVVGLSENSSSICTRETKLMTGLEKLKECSRLVPESCTTLSDNASEYQGHCTGEMTHGTNILCDEFAREGNDGYVTHLASQNQACCTGEVAHETNILYEEFTRDGNEENVANVASQPEADEPSTCSSEKRHTDAEVHEESQNISLSRKKLRTLWKHLVKKKQGDMRASVLERPLADAKMTSRIKVKRNKKKLMELTGVYMGQEIKAHKGLIWAMKFSPDGQYLASGGEDGVVRVWRLSSLDTSSKFSATADKFLSNVKEDTLGSLKKGSNTLVVLPKKVFHIEELPIHEFYGHSSGVLDLAWSDSNFIISASKDKTVRLWQVGCDECLNVFHHNDYVTCLQFNPVDENYFISGSLDGKIRIWGVSEKRVVDWADIREGITAISYQPDGNGFMAGSLTGCCRFYVAASGQHIQLGVQMYVQGKKKSSGNRITGIQFSREKCQSAIVASEDSKIRIFDGTHVRRKYKGLVKSGSPRSVSCTSTGKHIISVGKDSHVYMWNFSESDFSSKRPKKSVSSCESFFSEGVTVAIPWSSVTKEWTLRSSEMQPSADGTLIRNSETFSLSSWFPIDSSACRGSMTWPEERLPFYDVPVVADNFEAGDDDHPCKQPLLGDIHHRRSFSETWGLVIVTADSNGGIKAFHNFGLPIQD